MKPKLTDSPPKIAILGMTDAIWTRQEVQNWYLSNGMWVFWKGDRYTIKIHNLKCGLFSVTTVPYDPEVT